MEDTRMQPFMRKGVKGEKRTVWRFLVLAYLLCCVTANAQSRNEERTNSLAGLGNQLDKLAAEVAPAVVQVQVSAWSPLDWCSASTLTPMDQIKPNSSLPTAVTICGLFFHVREICGSADAVGSELSKQCL